MEAKEIDFAKLNKAVEKFGSLQKVNAQLEKDKLALEKGNAQLKRENKNLATTRDKLADQVEYINTKKVTAHPDSIKLLHSVYHGLEKVVETPAMREAEKMRLLADEVAKFKALKDQILGTKKDTSPKVATEPSEASRPAIRTEKASPQGSETQIVSQDLVFVLEEIKKVIKGEFESLKEELQSLMDDLHRR